MERWLLALGPVLFFSMLFVPTVYQPVKAVLLAVLVGAIVLGAFRQSIRIELHGQVFLWVGVIVVTGVAFMALGFFNGAPGALRVGTVYVLWPLVFMLLIAAIPSVQGLRVLLGTMVVAGVALGLYGAMYFAYVSGVWPDVLYLKLDQGQAVGFFDGFVEYNMYSIATLLFLVPFLFAALLQWSGRDDPVRRHWLWAAYALCLGLAILSGRRMLWLVLTVTPVFYVLLAWFQIHTPPPVLRLHARSCCWRWCR